MANAIEIRTWTTPSLLYGYRIHSCKGRAGLLRRNKGYMTFQIFTREVFHTVRAQPSARPFGGKRAIKYLESDAVSYTHLTLPTNREV